MVQTERRDSAASDPVEEALARGLRAGDPATVRDFLLRTHEPTYAMTARLTRDPDLRHDWCQDILLRIAKEVADGKFEYRRAGSFWAWFRMRANFLLINHYHAQKKHDRRWSIGETGAALAEAVPLRSGADPVRLLERVEMRQAIEECLARIESDDQRRALHLILFEERSYHEVAEAMDAALNTIRSWIRRGRIAVRRCVAVRLDYVDTEES